MIPNIISNMAPNMHTHTPWRQRAPAGRLVVYRERSTSGKQTAGRAEGETEGDTLRCSDRSSLLRPTFTSAVCSLRFRRDDGRGSGPAADGRLED